MKPYHWFQGDSVKELIEQLSLSGDNPRLEVHQAGKKMTLKVTGGSYDGPFINDSHVCPPQCP